MAGNKFDTGFEPWTVSDIKMSFTSLYGEKTTFEGSIEQCLRYLLKMRE